MNDQVKALFGIDPSDPTQVFEGFHSPEICWNGWATPAFARAEAERVVAWFNGDAREGSSMTWDGDVVVYVEADYCEEENYEPETFSADANGRYPIGAFSWTWSQIEPPEGADLGEWLTERDRVTRLYVEAANRALRAAYERGASVAEAGAASTAAGQEALARDVAYHDPAYEMPAAWLEECRDRPQETEFAEHAWLLMSGQQQYAHVVRYENKK